MTSVHCTICGSSADHAFQALVMGRHTVDFYQCASCGFLHTPEPAWLEEAYSAPIVAADTGLVQRNLTLSRVLSTMLFFLFRARARDRCLDMAGGYGLFVRLMRDIGYDFFWSDRYCDNLLARGFEGAAGETYSVVTAFEVVEHLPNPLLFMREAFSDSGCHSLVFTTELFEGVPPAPGQWWYYAFEAGQHVSFYQRRTLQAMADRLGKRLYSHGSIHMFTDRRPGRLWFALLSNSRIANLLHHIPAALLESRMVADHLLLMNTRRS